jgi:hypothetical protein
MTSETLYINIIDETVENILDSFFINFLDDKKIEKNIYSSEYILTNFSKIKLKIDNIILEIVNNKNIKSLISNANNLKQIINILDKYIYLYFFLYLSNKLEINIIVNILNKLYNKYLQNIFQDKYIVQYDIYYKLVKDSIFLIKNINKTGLLENKLNKEFLKDYNDDSIQLLQEFDIKVLKNIILNSKSIEHNIIKIIIFKEIYTKEDKKTIFKILENEQYKEAKYKYIDIVDTKFDTIDYSTIETLFNLKDIKLGMADNFFQMLIDYDMVKFIKDYTIDDKINQLFDKKILIPITDEFLRYHKDSELYDKDINTKIDAKEKTTKKNNTKIRYIITKINKVKDYYSYKIINNPELKNEIEKLFYQPLLYRKAVLINDIEEINIIRKLILQGITISDSNEYYQDLIKLRMYPYIDFRYNNKQNFTFVAKNTIQAIRYCNIEYKNDINILKTKLQYRVINDTMRAHIIGVALPRYNFLENSSTILACHNIDSLMDIKLLNQNSFQILLIKLKRLFLENKQYSKILYWIFNKKTDKIKLELFNNIEELSTDEYIKLLLGIIYDNVVDITYEIILNQLEIFDYINFSMGRKIMKDIESKLVLIPRESIKYAKLMKIIYYLKSKINIDVYDKSEDKIIGINTPIIKLPKIILEKIKIHIIKILKSELFIDYIDESNIYDNYTCQHIVSWNNILKIKKNNINLFNQELFNFIKKYVVENKDQDFVCKSCYQLVDIKQYTTDIYPGSDSISISYNLEKELETMLEYSKLVKSIKNIEKIIEQIANASNINYYVGPALEVKLRRQELIKIIIDLVDVQYNTLFTKNPNIRKERLEKSIKKYGCNLSNFFLFKLENEIFTYSSKETDKFKLYKINNILTYIIISYIININLSQILYLSFDKLVNYFLFEKFGFDLFTNLYIKISNKNDIAPIKNYKLLCYIIYYLSGIITKFNMWFVDNITYKQNNINLQIQKIIIHTFIDCINTILDVNNNNKSYLYSIFSNKFFNKLNTIYNNNNNKDIFDKLENINKKKIIITNDKKLKYASSTIDSNLIKPFNYTRDIIIKSILGTNNIITSYPSTKIITNQLKNISIYDLFSNSYIKELNDKFIDETLHKIASLYDNNGVKRNNPLLEDEILKLDKKELKNIYDKVRKTRLKNLEIKNKKEVIDDSKKYINKIIKEYSNELYDDIINNFITKLELLIGKNININKNNYYLFDNVYIIDHDYRGNKIKTFFINKNDIKFKKNDTYFKQDIYYYEDNINKVTLYYSSINKYLLGYKENSKDYIKVYNTNCYLKINYSIFNQLKFFGFNYMYYRIEPKYKVDNMFEYINNILRIRLQNLKNSISNILQILYQIIYKFDGPNLNPIAKYYQNKIKNINIYDTNSNQIFDDWTYINNILFNEIDETSKITIKTINNIKYLDSNNLLQYMTNDNIMIFYLIKKFELLLDINDDNYTKINIAYLIINIIIQLSNNFFIYENAFFDINVKNFYQFISNKSNLPISYDEIDKDLDISNMNEEQLENYKEELEIEREAEDALDVSNDDANEDFGDEDVVLVDRSYGDY